MKYYVEVGGATHEVEVRGDRVLVDGVTHQARLSPGNGALSRVLVLDGRIAHLGVERMAKSGEGWVIYDQGERIEVRIRDERVEKSRRSGPHGPDPTGTPAGTVELRAPMPGLVVRLPVEPGQEVIAGTGVVVLEAMKMENELRTTVPGIVDRLLVRPGQRVEKGELLAVVRGSVASDGAPASLT